MDPISGAIGIASGAVTLSGLALTIGKTLTGFVNVYQRSALHIYSLIGACKAIEIAWNSIHSWIETQTSLQSVDTSLLDQLKSTIEVGKIVLGALEKDLEPYDLLRIAPIFKKTSKAAGKLETRQKLKAVLDEDVFKDHCVKLNLLVSSLHLLLATTALSVICSSFAVSVDTVIGLLLKLSPTCVTVCAQFFARMKKLHGQ